MGKFAAAAWGDAATFVPWTLYQRFGDEGVLARQFDSMRAWVEFVRALAGETLLWPQMFQLGDWLDPDAPPDQPWRAKTDAVLVATAYFAQSARLVSLAAGVLGLADLADEYGQLAEDYPPGLPPGVRDVEWVGELRFGHRLLAGPHVRPL